MNTQRVTLRTRVLNALATASRPLTGHEVAQRVGVPYKPAIDALNSLLNYERVQRVGRKFTAKWQMPKADSRIAAMSEIERAFLRMKR